MRIISTAKIIEDEYHNAFTDLVKYNGKYYLTYRVCPEGHMLFPTSRIEIICSINGKKWNKVHSFNVPGRDTRDPHFLVFDGKLFVYSGTWKIIGDTAPYQRDFKELEGYLCYTRDGKNWTDPQPAEGTKEYYIWRTGTYGGKAYMCGRRYEPTGDEYVPMTDMKGQKSYLMGSEDGLSWHVKGIFQTERGDETDFLFEENGDILALSRVMERNTQWRSIPSQVSYASPPYEQWERIQLNERLECPLLIKLRDCYMAAGRWLKPDSTCEGGVKPVMAVFYLKDNKLELAAELSSGGDSSYPGFVDMGEGRGLLSYYSSHENTTSIYVAEIEY